MNKRQRKKFEKKQEQQIQAISRVFEALKNSIEKMMKQMKEDPAAFRKVVIESDLPVETKLNGILLSRHYEKKKQESDYL